MIDVVVFMRRFGDDLLDRLDGWMGYGMAGTVMYQVVTAVTDWCRYII